MKTPLLLGTAVLAVLAVGCSGPADPAPEPAATFPTPTEPTAATKPPRAQLADLPTGALPRIGYVDHLAYVAADGTRSPLPRHLGVSGIVPYAGGFLMADTRFFEGTLGLNVVRDGRVVDSHCSTGVPSRRHGWLTWVVASCPESADLVRAEVHRARPDGSHETVRRIAPRSAGERSTPALSAAVPDLPRGWHAEASAREGGGRVLFVAIQGRWTAIVRVGPDGAVELATPVARYDPNRPAYALGPGR